MQQKLVAAWSLALCACLVHAQAPSAVPCAIEGTVFATGKHSPIPGARIKLFTDGDEPYYTRADQRGQFRIENLAPKAYNLWVEYPGYERNRVSIINLWESQPSTTRPQHCCTPWMIPDQDAGAFTLATDSSGVRRATLTIPLTRSVIISGRVTDPQGAPLEGFSVQLQTRNTLGPEAADNGKIYTAGPILHTDERGEFRSARPSGSYYVAVGMPELPLVWDDSYRITYYPHTTDQRLAKALELAPGESVRIEMQIVAQKGVRVAGHISFPEGTDSNGVATRVALLAAGVTVVSDGLSTYGGQDYEFNDVPPGRYSLAAATVDHPNPVYGFMRSILIGNHDEDKTDLALQSLKDLEVITTFRGCEPFPLRIYAHNEGPFEYLGPQTVTGADGTAVIRGLMTGHHKLFVSALDASPMLTIGSAGFGAKDVLKDGFDAPVSGEEPLRIEIICGNGVR